MEPSLRILVSSIADLAKKVITSNSIIPEKESFFHWELRDFKYTEKGVENTSAQGKTTTKKNWSSVIRRLMETVVKSSEFTEVIKKIKSKYKKSTDPKSDLEKFCIHILSFYLNNHKSRKKKVILDIIKRFIRDLKGGPINASAVFNLYGLAIESKKIKLTKDISIRQARKEDFEIPVPSRGYLNNEPPSFYRHSVVLTVDLNFINGEKINNTVFQIKADKYIALFQLFKTGSIYYFSYQMFSDVICFPFIGGKLTSYGKSSFRKKSYFIKKRDEKSLHYFLNNLLLPEYIYDDFSKKVDYLTIAFDRYRESLLESTSFERRITNSVMGLEALFSTDSIELSFKLSTRVSKILSFFNQDPLEVKKAISLAYSVRSTFSHGGHLDTKMKNKIEEKYVNLGIFSQLILNYLRISLIIMISSDLKKRDLIELIDQSLIEKIKNSELKLQLKKIKPLVKN